MEKASEFVLGSVHQDMELHLLFQSTFFKYFTNETKLCIVSKRGGSQVEVVLSMFTTSLIGSDGSE